jgi:hypothetical protein
MFFYNSITIRIFLLFFFCACFFYSGSTKAQGALKDLQVASICQKGDNPETQWCIRNPNYKDINVTYSTSGGKQVSSISAKAMDDTFFTPKPQKQLMSYVDVLYSDGKGKLKRISTASGGETCIIDCPVDADRYLGRRKHDQQGPVICFCRHFQITASLRNILFKSPGRSKWGSCKNS